MTSLDPDSVRAVARKDFADAVRSRALLVLGGVFVLFFLASSAFFADRVTQAIQQAAEGQQPQISSTTYLQGLAQVTRLLVPLVGIVTAYASVAGERDSGSLKLLLALPHSRLDVLIGKLVGRSGVVAVPVLLGFLVAVPVFPLFGVAFEAGGYAAFALATALVGVVFVALSLGASAAAATARRAVIALVGLFTLFTLLWGQFSSTVVNQVADRTGVGNTALVKLLVVARHLNPVATYQSLVASIGTPTAQARASLFGGLQRAVISQQLAEVPVYLTDAALVGYLLLWVVVPVALGYVSFEAADL